MELTKFKFIIFPNFANNADVELLSSYAYVISEYFTQHVFSPNVWKSIGSHVT